MKKITKRIITMGILAVLICTFCSLTAFAASSDNVAAAGDDAAAETQTTNNDSIGDKAIGAAICVGLAAAGAAVGMGIAIGKSSEGISRQPEATGNIRTTLMLGLVFIETAIIYALIIAILVIFVL